MKTWWRQGFDVSMQLLSISRKMDFKKRKNGKKDFDAWLEECGEDLWDVSGVDWKLKWRDVRGNGDYMEEQLWAIRQGLA